MRSKGYGSRSVCLSVCLSPTFLTLQTTRQLMSDTNSLSATRARKAMWLFYGVKTSEKANNYA